MICRYYYNPAAVLITVSKNRSLLHNPYVFIRSLIFYATTYVFRISKVDNISKQVGFYVKASYSRSSNKIKKFFFDGTFSETL